METVVLRTHSFYLSVFKIRLPKEETLTGASISMTVLSIPSEEYLKICVKIRFESVDPSGKETDFHM